MNDCKGLLVLKADRPLSEEQIENLMAQLEPLAEKLGVEPMVLPAGLDVELKMAREGTWERVCAALEKIAAADTPPVVETQEGPSERPTLNRRAEGLNSRPPAAEFVGLAYPGVVSIPEVGTFPLANSEKVDR